MKRRLGVLAAALVLSATLVQAHTYFVDTTGSDTNPGTIDSAFATIPKAAGLVVPGDTIYLRGGNYVINTTVTISRSGTAGNLCNLLAYPGEQPRLDFSGMAINSSNRGIKLNGSYWHIKGLEIFHAGDNGMIINGSNNIVERCVLHENADTGLQLAAGASNNQIINCDSFDNVDPSQGNADGFSPKLDVGTGNYFYGCRSWQNSDDGWDGYLSTSNGVSTTIENCWSFMNGYLKSGSASIGNGNGFKMGGSAATNLEHNMTLRNCVAFGNRVKGFDQNNDRGSMTLLNCTGFSNGTNNFSIPLTPDSGKMATITNCISAGTGSLSLGSFVVQTTDSWLSAFTTPSSGDFVSMDTTGVRGPRQADGSLPDVPFMHLATGSQFIGKGTIVGIPFAGAAPDLGAFPFTPSPSAKLVDFAANVVNGNSVRLSWTTLSENNVTGFIVQRRAPADTVWSMFPGDSLSGQGTSTFLHQYAVVDTTAIPGTWVYRVMQTFSDSAARFSVELTITMTAPSGVNDGLLPATFALYQNYPNPFNPTTAISYQLSGLSRVTLKVYDILGREVATLVNGYQQAGMHTVTFSATGLASGAYFYRLRSGTQVETRKCMLVR